jgi:hypothetical protein
MALNDVYLVSQIAAAVLLVPSLIYLALQVRQNTLAMRASAAQHYLETAKDLNLALIANKQAASVYRRGTENFGALDEDEKTQFFFYVAQFYQSFADMHALWRQKTLPDAAWLPIRKHLISMMAMPGTRHVFDSWARGGLSPAFVAYVDKIARSGETTYSLESGLAGRDPAAETKT